MESRSRSRRKRTLTLIHLFCRQVKVKSQKSKVTQPQRGVCVVCCQDVLLLSRRVVVVNTRTATSSHLLLSPPKVLQGNCILPQLVPCGFPRYVSFYMYIRTCSPCTLCVHVHVKHVYMYMYMYTFMVDVRDVQCDCNHSSCIIHWAFIRCHISSYNRSLISCTRVVQFEVGFSLI